MNTFSIKLAVELVPLLQAEVRKLREMLASQQLESQGRQPLGWGVEGEPKVTECLYISTLYAQISALHEEI